MMGQIKIKIPREGKILVEVQGVVGQACLKIPEDIIALLGKVSKETYTQEYYQQAEIAINRNEN